MNSFRDGVITMHCFRMCQYMCSYSEGLCKENDGSFNISNKALYASLELWQYHLPIITLCITKQQAGWKFTSMS